MKIVDRYILRAFLFSFVVVFVAMIALTIMVDMVLNLDEFLKAAPGEKSIGALEVLWRILTYYFYRTFDYFQWLCGAVMLVAAAFTVARLNKTNELIAMKASGISVYRLLWPIIVAGMVVSCLYVIDQEVILPYLIDELTGERAVSGGKKEFPILYITDQQNSLVYAPKYNPLTQKMQGEPADPVRIVRRNQDTSENVAFIQADSASYDAKRRGWALVNGRERDAPQPNRPVPTKTEEGTPVAFYATDIDPARIARQRHADFYRYLSFVTMRNLLGDAAVVNNRIIEVAMYKHFAKPMLNVVLLLLGLPFVVGQEGKSYLMSIMICIGLFVLVLGTEYVTTEFGNSGHLPAILAVFLPVLIFTPLAIWSMYSVKT